MQIDIIVNTINPGYEISSNGPRIAAIPSKSSNDIMNDSAVVASNVVLNFLFPIDLKVHKYFVYILFSATAVVKHEKIIIIAINNAPFLPNK